MKIKILIGGAVLAALSFNALGGAASLPAAASSPAATVNPAVNYNPSVKKEVSYKKDVFPILYDYCLNCHSPEGKGYNKSGLDMRTYESLMKGTKFGPVVKPGDPESSTFVMMVEGRAKPELHMPPLNGRLYKEHLTILRKWVHQGAKDN